MVRVTFASPLVLTPLVLTRPHPRLAVNERVGDRKDRIASGRGQSIELEWA
jgi:hypothetical protein